MRKYLIAITPILIGIAAACGGGDGGTEPVNADVTGTWTVATSPIQGHGVYCQIVGLEVVMVQSGTDLTGTYSADDMVCNGQHSGPMSGTIVSGTNLNGRLHFHFDVEAFDLHGTCMSSDRAQGNYTIVLVVSGQSYTFRGTWTANRT